MMLSFFWLNKGSVYYLGTSFFRKLETGDFVDHLGPVCSIAAANWRRLHGKIATSSDFGVY